MALNIKNDEADELARLLAERTGRTITGALIYALREQLRREAIKSTVPDLADELMAIGRHCADLPDLDSQAGGEPPVGDEQGTWS